MTKCKSVADPPRALAPLRDLVAVGDHTRVGAHTSSALVVAVGDGCTHLTSLDVGRRVLLSFGDPDDFGLNALATGVAGTWLVAEGAVLAVLPDDPAPE